jgi:hypothetical protein
LFLHKVYIHTIWNSVNGFVLVGSERCGSEQFYRPIAMARKEQAAPKSGLSGNLPVRMVNGDQVSRETRRESPHGARHDIRGPHAHRGPREPVDPSGRVSTPSAAGFPSPPAEEPLFRVSAMAYWNVYTHGFWPTSDENGKTWRRVYALLRAWEKSQFQMSRR